MVSLMDDLQRDFLDMLQAHHPDNKQFGEDLEHIRKKVVPSEETPSARELRLQAEQRVKLFVLEKGERIGHGDLLTFHKVNTAKLKRALSVTAIDRLEYLGLFRMQLFHLVGKTINLEIPK